MKNYLRHLLALLSTLFLMSCTTSTGLINSNSIYKGMTVQEFRNTMFYGVNAREDPWTGDGSRYDHEYQGYHLVYGYNPDEIVFIFDEKHLLFEWVPTISLAQQVIDKEISANKPQNTVIAQNNATNKKGWLGIYIAEITPEISSAYGLNQSTGAFVSSVVDNSPAQMGGIEAGDVIVLFDGHVINNWNDLPSIIQASVVNRQLEVTIIRNNGFIRVPVTLVSKDYSNQDIDEDAEPKNYRNKNSNTAPSNNSQYAENEDLIFVDTQNPVITITRADTNDKQGIIKGRARDNVGVAEITIDGSIIPFTSNGRFEYSTYVPASGKTVEVQVTDLAGLSSTRIVTLERNVNFANASMTFDELNPIDRPAKRNNNALALIIGVSDYRNTTAKAVFADADAIMFRDYASEKLGIPDHRIKTLVNDGADEREMLLAIQSWLSRSVKQDQTDVYVFFAGHGLASDDGQNMYLLPYDGSPELLDDTAILRDRLFNDIASANPRSVTVFLDTCYSGSTRGSEVLIAARPILLKAKESSVPDGFTVFTAAAGDETAKPLEEAKHGLFSYFLMKGMEGDADTNGDKQITAGELHSYVKSNVVQQSSGTQTPELQGDADRVLVRFQ
jgi:membrane-associated protease RseP (regulator of RpoE activity)